MASNKLIGPRSFAAAIQPNENDLAAKPVDWAQWRAAAGKYGARALESLALALQAPGDVYAGRLDPNSDAAFERVQTLSGLLGPGPLASGKAGLKAGWAGPGKLPEHLADKLPVDLTDMAWVVGGKHGNLDDPKHAAAIVNALGVPPKKLLEQIHKENVMPDGWIDKVLGEIKAYEQAPKANPLPEAHVLHGPALQMLEKLPEGPMYQEFGPKIAQEMLKNGQTDPLLAMDHVTGKLSEAEFKNYTNYLETAKAMAQVEPSIETELAGLLGKIKNLEIPAPGTEAKNPFEGAFASAWPERKEATYGANLNDAIQPFDYRTYLPDEARGPIGPKVAEAAKLGFNVDLPLYKGMDQDLVDFLDKKTPTNYLWNPDSKPHERAVFAADKPEVASRYAEGGQGSHVMPMYAAPRQAYKMNWGETWGSNSYDPTWMKNSIEHARQRGADMLVIENIHDIGGRQTQYAIMDPSILRSPYAKFDPDKVGYNDLLAARGSPYSLIPVDHDPFGGTDDK